MIQQNDNFPVLIPSLKLYALYFQGISFKFGLSVYSLVDDKIGVFFKAKLNILIS